MKSGILVFGRFQDNSSTDISSTTLRLQTFRLQTFRLLLMLTLFSHTSVQDSYTSNFCFSKSLFSSIPNSTYTMIPFYQSHFHWHYDNTQGFFVNNISGYAKFPMTCFLGIYQKTYDFLFEIFFGDLFLSTIQKIPISKPNFFPFLVIYHKTISL